MNKRCRVLKIMLPPITNFTKLRGIGLKRAQTRNAISFCTLEHCRDHNKGAGAFAGFTGWWSQYFFRSSSPTRLIRGLYRFTVIARCRGDT